MTIFSLLIVVINSVVTSVSGQQLDCNFDQVSSGFCNWSNGINGVEDDFDWQIGNSVPVDGFHSIPRSLTGFGNFGYAQGSHRPVATDTARAWLRSPTINGLTTSSTLSFNYWKTAAPPVLQICTREAGATQLRCLDSISGLGNQQWTRREVPIPATPVPFQIILVATNFRTGIDLIGLDDLRFKTSSSDPRSGISPPLGQLRAKPSKSAGQPLNPLQGQPLGPPLGQPLGQPLIPPLSQPLTPPLGQSLGPSLGPSLGQPLGQPLEQPIGQPLGQLLGQPLGHPLGETLGQPLGQPRPPPLGQRPLGDLEEAVDIHKRFPDTAQVRTAVQEDNGRLQPGEPGLPDRPLLTLPPPVRSIIGESIPGGGLSPAQSLIPVNQPSVAAVQRPEVSAIDQGSFPINTKVIEFVEAPPSSPAPPPRFTAPPSLPVIGAGIETSAVGVTPPPVGDITTLGSSATEQGHHHHPHDEFSFGICTAVACPFDDSTCQWLNDQNSNFEWKIKNNHSLLQGIPQDLSNRPSYLFVSGDQRRPDQKATIRSPQFVTPSGSFLEFFHFITDPTVTRLSVHRQVGPESPNILWQSLGNRQVTPNVWQRVRVPLPASSFPMTVSIVSDQLSTGQYMGVDDLRLVDNSGLDISCASDSSFASLEVTRVLLLTPFPPKANEDDLRDDLQLPPALAAALLSGVQPQQPQLLNARGWFTDPSPTTAPSAALPNRLPPPPLPPSESGFPLLQTTRTPSINQANWVQTQGVIDQATDTVRQTDRNVQLVDWTSRNGQSAPALVSESDPIVVPPSAIPPRYVQPTTPEPPPLLIAPTSTTGGVVRRTTIARVPRPIPTHSILIGEQEPIVDWPRSIGQTGYAVETTTTTTTIGLTAPPGPLADPLGLQDFVGSLTQDLQVLAGGGRAALARHNSLPINNFAGTSFLNQNSAQSQLNTGNNWLQSLFSGRRRR